MFGKGITSEIIVVSIIVKRDHVRLGLWNKDDKEKVILEERQIEYEERDQDLDVTMADGRVKAVEGTNGLAHIRKDVEDLSFCEIVLEPLIEDAVQTSSCIEFARF